MMNINLRLIVPLFVLIAGSGISEAYGVAIARFDPSGTLLGRFIIPNLDHGPIIDFEDSDIIFQPPIIWAAAGPRIVMLDVAGRQVNESRLPMGVANVMEAVDLGSSQEVWIGDDNEDVALISRLNADGKILGGFLHTGRVDTIDEVGDEIWVGGKDVTRYDPAERQIIGRFDLPPGVVANAMAEVDISANPEVWIWPEPENDIFEFYRYDFAGNLLGALPLTSAVDSAEIVGNEIWTIGPLGIATIYDPLGKELRSFATGAASEEGVELVVVDVSETDVEIWVSWIPEPSSFALMGLAVAALGCHRLRRLN